MTSRGHRRLFSAAILLAAPVALCTFDHVAAQPPRRPAAIAVQSANNAAVAPDLAAKLTATYQAAVDGKPLRELLRQIAGAADFNLWIDRNVDPDQLLSLAGGQKTVFASLVEAARAGGADVVAVGNMVLVGQRKRIEQLAGAILALPRDDVEPAQAGSPTKNKVAGRTEIRWPAATTPTEALRIASPQTAGQLPHDHWPEVAWRDISPQVATLLVTSQFDLMPASDRIVEVEPAVLKRLAQPRPEPRSSSAPSRANLSNEATFDLVPLAAPPLLTLRYPNGPHVRAMGPAAIEVDRHAMVNTRRDENAAGGIAVELAGSPAAHVAAIIAMLNHSTPRPQPSVDIDKVRFTLNLRGAPAQDVLVQLATAAGRKLKIADQAVPLMRRTITFDLQDHSLKQLVRAVTDQIGADAHWSQETLTITSSQ